MIGAGVCDRSKSNCMTNHKDAREVALQLEYDPKGGGKCSS